MTSGEEDCGMPRFRNNVLISAAAGLAGLVAAILPLPIFTGAPFTLGPAVYFTVGVVLGPVFGLVASLIPALLYLTAGAVFGPSDGLLASLATAIPVIGDWPGVYGLLLGAEVVFVSWAVRRHGFRPVAAVTLFRISVLLPWGVTVYRLGLAHSNPEVWVGLLRLISNGVICALLTEWLISTGVLNRLIPDPKAKPHPQL